MKVLWGGKIGKTDLYFRRGFEFPILEQYVFLGKFERKSIFKKEKFLT